ncbi:hypothetical protein D8S93_24540 [Vibrio sp. VGrn 2]|uniref:hypothetical protein n=1 Tax=Vibrio sp. VGrn 2 TaxID=2419839 RepID=UPI00128BC484|nr:hypothetical protein [Vibrio sp. VGrn 2]MPS41729.1 hypothetical protein [Vibrio sp. VGrn 2]
MMEASEVASFLSDLVKPGSAILGLIIIIQFLHTVLDSSRVYKIKQLELLQSCMKDRDSIGSIYVVEKLLEHTYKVHIPYAEAMVIMEHSKRQELFNLYKASYKYLDFSHRSFSLPPKFDSKRAVCVEKYKRQLINAFKYYTSAFFGGISLVMALNLLSDGLLKVQFITYNIVYFAGFILISSILFKVAFNALMDPSNIKLAKKFKDCFDSEKTANKNSLGVLSYC